MTIDYAKIQSIAKLEPDSGYEAQGSYKNTAIELAKHIMLTRRPDKLMPFDVEVGAKAIYDESDIERAYGWEFEGQQTKEPFIRMAQACAEAWERQSITVTREIEVETASNGR